MKNQEIILEIKDAEGGMDAKLIVEDMGNIYLKACNIQGFKVETLQWREGIVRIKIIGKDCKKFFDNEKGNHKWQRTGPTEKRGRVHTSSITVSVVDNNIKKQVVINPNDVQKKYTRGSGAGGQNRNKVESVVVLTHIPSGIVVRSETQRTQARNEQIAWELLTERLQYIEDNKYSSNIRQQKNVQTNRTDKRRTYRVKDDLVIDHITGKSAKLKMIMRGKIELLK